MALYVYLATLASWGVAQASSTCSNKRIPPSGATCFQNGSVSAATTNGGQPTVLESFNACRKLSFQDSTVASYSWNHVNGQCKLYTTTVSAGHFTEAANSPAEFADKSCSTCTAVCPSSYTANQFTNPGFELSSKFVGPWTAPNSNITALSVAMPGDDHSLNAMSVRLDSELQQSINYLCGDADYFIRFDYKFTRAGTASVAYDYMFGGSYGAFINQQSNTTWTTYEDYAPEVPTGASYINFDLYDYDHTGIEWQFDNFGLYQTPPAVLMPGAKEMVVNGGFETGKLAPFSVEYGPTPKDTVAIISPGLGGSKHALQINGKVDSDVLLVANVTLIQGTHYLFSFDYYYARTTTAANNILLDLRVTGGEQDSLLGNVDSYYGYNSFNTKGNGTFERRIVAHGAVNLVEIEFSWNDEEVQSKYYEPVIIDNISIKEVQKPSVA